MKRTMNLLTVLALAAFVLFYAVPQSFAQEEGDDPVVIHGPNFVDENGDGYNDNAPDADGDGIPNGMDEDYVSAGRGTGGLGFVDEDGDGINDNAPDADGDGIPNGQDADYVKAKDGTGAGKGRGLGKGFAGFVDEDGDGINDRMMDDDADGVPNGQDADWVKPEDCLGRGTAGRGMGRGAVGEDGEPRVPGRRGGGNSPRP